MTTAPACRRCGRPVLRFREQFEVFEGMHWVCFHYEFEHDPTDPDNACGDLSCPSRQLGEQLPIVAKDARLARTVALLANDLGERFLVLDTSPADLTAVNLASREDPRRSVYVSTLSNDELFNFELEDAPEESDLPYAGHGIVEGVTYIELRDAIAAHLGLGTADGPS